MMDDDLFTVLDELISQLDEPEDTLSKTGSDDIDALLFEASQQFEEQPQNHSTGIEKSIASHQFPSPVTEEDLLAKIDRAVPRSTRKTTTWSIKTWKDWADHRRLTGSAAPPELTSISNDELNHFLSRFVNEVRNKDGGYYHGGTLYSLCSGIQHFVREKRGITTVSAEPLDIYKDPCFEFFRRCFDSVLKELHSNGIGARKKQADVISSDTEEELWIRGCLGEDKPQQLLDTMIYCLGLNLALRSGKEHRDLRADMLEVIECPASQPYILYTESGSKNHTGGLRERKVKNKSVKIFSNQDNPARCVVRLYKKFMSLRPQNAPQDILYFTPLKDPLPNCWYSLKPVGHNTLSKTVKKLCCEIGIEDNYTKH